MFVIIFRVINVYYSFLTDFSVDKSKIKYLTNVRAEYLNNISDKKRLKQSYSVWKLLEYVLENDFSIYEKDFLYNADGSWELKGNKVRFSLTHSNNLVAVAISTNFVGIDAEMCSKKLLKLKPKFDFNDFSNLTEEQSIQLLTKKWTEKESLFKSKCGNNFNSIKVFDKSANSYCLTVCSLDNEINFIEIENDKFL